MAFGDEAKHHVVKGTKFYRTDKIKKAPENTGIFFNTSTHRIFYRSHLMN
jgi:hypothetical protein